MTQANLITVGGEACGRIIGKYFRELGVIMKLKLGVHCSRHINILTSALAAK